MAHDIREGSVVVAPNKRVIDGKPGEPRKGTIVAVLADKRYLVLDSDGLIHIVFLNEIYLSQEPTGP